MSAYILHTALALPEYSYAQSEIAAVISAWLGERKELAARASAILENSEVERRYTVRPAEWYLGHTSVSERSAVYSEEMVRLCVQACGDALAGAGLEPADIDLIVSTSCTGIMIPAVDSHLMNRLAFRPETRRQPLTELGCVAGAAALSQADTYLRAHPGHAALVVSAELASLTAQVQDFSLTNIVAGAIFGDGAAATVLVGEEKARSMRDGAAAGRIVPQIVATRSTLFPDTLDMMGFANTDTGLRIVLSPRVPRFLAGALPPLLTRFLADHGLALSDVAHFLLHPGGRKVIEGLERALGLAPEHTAGSRRVLREFGNLSSATVLYLLHLHQESGHPSAGEHGLLMAVGPGFCAEFAILRWVPW